MIETLMPNNTRETYELGDEARAVFTNQFDEATKSLVSKLEIYKGKAVVEIMRNLAMNEREYSASMIFHIKPEGQEGKGVFYFRQYFSPEDDITKKGEDSAVVRTTREALDYVPKILNLARNLGLAEKANLICLLTEAQNCINKFDSKVMSKR